jgi:hypothetical protein
VFHKSFYHGKQMKAKPTHLEISYSSHERLVSSKKLPCSRHFSPNWRHICGRSNFKNQSLFRNTSVININSLASAFMQRNHNINGSLSCLQTSLPLYGFILRKEGKHTPHSSYSRNTLNEGRKLHSLLQSRYYHLKTHSHWIQHQ